MLNSIGNKTISTGQTLAFTVTAVDPDGDMLTYSASNMPSGVNFNTSTKAFSWTPTGTQVGSYADIHFQVSDGVLTDTENITITVDNVNVPSTDIVNLPPVLNSIGNKTISTGQTLAFSLSATDPDSADLVFSAHNLPPEASFDPSTPNFLWTPNTDQVGSYPDIRFQVSDGILTDFEEITITVNQVNQPPVLSSIGNKSITTGQTLIFALPAVDPDGDTLTYSVYNMPSGANFNTSTKAFSWTPTDTQVGSYAAIHFQVSDGVLTDFEEITITVNQVNQPPVLSSIGNKSISTGQTLTFTLSASDTDSTDLVFSAHNLPPEASFDPSTRNFVWTPNADQVGSYPNIHFQVSDGMLTDFEEINIKVIVDRNKTSKKQTIAQYLNQTGVFNQEVEAKSDDGMINIIIPAGTSAKTAEDITLDYVTLAPITQDEQYKPTNAGGNVVGLTYNLEPDGSTFNPPITLSIKYDPTLISGGATESKLVVGYWNETEKVWMPLSNSKVDSIRCTVSAPISHFSVYAILSLSPEEKTSSIIEVPASPDRTATVTNASVTAPIYSGETSEHQIPESIEDHSSGSVNPGVFTFELSLLLKTIGAAMVVFAIITIVILIIGHRMRTNARYMGGSF